MTIKILFDLFISLIIPLLVGMSILQLLFTKQMPNLFLRLSMAFGLGLGVITQIMLLLCLLNFPMNRITTTSVIFILIGMMAFAVWKKGGYPFEQSQKEEKNRIPYAGKKRSKLTKLIITTILIYGSYQILFIFWRALNVPINTWDAILLIAVKAKVFFFDQHIQKVDSFPLPSYPLGGPLALSWVAFNLGHWNDQLVKILFPTIACCYLGIHYSFLKLSLNRFYAVIGTAILLTSNFFVFHATIEYLDIFVLYYQMTAILLLLWANKTDNDHFYFLSGLFTALALTVKLETFGYWMIDFLLLIILLNRQKISLGSKFKQLLKFILPGLVIASIYCWFVQKYSLPIFEGRLQLDLNAGWLTRLPTIFLNILDNLFLSGNWNIIWGILALSLFKHGKKILQEFSIRFLAIGLVLFLGLYISVALFTSNFDSIAGIHSSSVSSRIILHFFPLAPLLITLLNFPKDENS